MPELFGHNIYGIKKLQSLNLSYNQIGDEGAKALGEALKVNSSLEWIYLALLNILKK